MANQYAEQITDALAKLDTQNPDHWTDDGLPVTRMVQTLAGEPNIKRSDINEVAPGFSRDSVTETAADPVVEVAPVAATAPAIDPITGLTTSIIDGGEQSEEWKAELKQAFEDAEAALVEANQGVLDARKVQQNAQRARDAALTKMNAAFPPLSHAQNIQQYLNSENAARAAKFGAIGVYAQSPLDAVMSARRGRHNSRPQRGQTVAR